jgi:hypothetical protein
MTTHGRARAALLRAATAAGLLTVLALAGCSTGANSTRGQGALNTTTTPPPSAPASAPASTPATEPSTPATPPSTPATQPPPGKPSGKQYDRARTQWQQGATAISAEQGKFWLAAAADLTAGEVTDTGDTSGYLAAIKALTELAALPDAQQTPAQNAEFHADIKTLNTFFNTPGLYS